MRLHLPSPSGRAAYPVVPVFMPFAGCPHRCIFCAQERQTGVGKGGTADALNRLNAELIRRRSCGAGPCQVAFYGGTFTLLPEAEQLACLEAVSQFKAAGDVRAVRCSTRPDAVTLEGVRRLRDAGMDLIELGIQSFSGAALEASGRGYSKEQAEEGCAAVRGAGLRLGIQLLPGLPGAKREDIVCDVRHALDFSPACLRMYPCLVVEGTGLAALWRAGHYEPWTIEETAERLGRALALAWEREVPVIRLSLAPEPALEAAVLAGPRHPSLGGMIQAEALFLRLRGWLGGRAQGGGRLRLPRYLQGCFAGYRGAMLPRWQSLGLSSRMVEWTDNAFAEWIPLDSQEGKARESSGFGEGTQKS